METRETLELLSFRALQQKAKEKGLTATGSKEDLITKIMAAPPTETPVETVIAEGIASETQEPEEEKPTPPLKVVGDKVNITDGKTWKEVLAALSVDLPEKAIERTKGGQTGKGYDTTGYKYQFVVNRFNEVLGINNWWYDFEILDRANMTTSKGRARIQITVRTAITLRCEGEEVTKALVGGHNSGTYDDALKGAITNSLKKTAAMFGNGKAAYEVTIDDDNTPATNNEPGVPPSKSGYTNQGRGYVTQKQAEAIGKLLGALGMDVEQVKARNGWDSLYVIPFAKGAEMMNYLTRKMDEKVKADAAAKAAREAAPPADFPTIDYGDPSPAGMSDADADALMASL